MKTADRLTSGTEQCPEIELYVCNNLIYDIGYIKMQWGKNGLFQKMMMGQLYPYG